MFSSITEKAEPDNTQKKADNHNFHKDPFCLISFKILSATQDAICRVKRTNLTFKLLQIRYFEHYPKKRNHWGIMSFYKFCITTLLIISINSFAKEYKLFYLGGQANSEGFGDVTILSPELIEKAKSVRIFHGNTSPDKVPVDGKGVWSKLKPGHGKNFVSDGKTNTYSDMFGCELTLGTELKKLFPNDHIAIIKYARGGTSIDEQAARKFGCWQVEFSSGDGEFKTINQYDHFAQTVKNALSVKDIDGDGEEDKLIPTAIFWLQGESDASVKEEVAHKYKAHLKTLMTKMREAFNSPKLPIVVAQMTDRRLGQENRVWKHGAIVRRHQKEFCEQDANAILLTENDNYTYSGRAHYDTEAFIRLGKDFVESVKELLFNQDFLNKY